MTLQQPRSIAVFNGKGGVGKSTVAQVLGVEIGAHWLDTDPQASLSDWGQLRGDGRVTHATAAQAALDHIDRSTGPLVVDTPGVLTAGGQALLGAVDLVVIPTSGRQTDVQALGKTVGAIHQLGLADRAIIVLTRVHPRINVAALLDLFSELQLPVCPHRLAERSVYDRAQYTGQTAAEVEPNGPAAAESAALAQWVLSHGR
jgi:cellulose biosynthesis protein BcsQ